MPFRDLQIVGSVRFKKVFMVGAVPVREILSVIVIMDVGAFAGVNFQNQFGIRNFAHIHLRRGFGQYCAGLDEDGAYV